MQILPVYGAAQLAKAGMGAAGVVTEGFAGLLKAAVGQGADTDGKETSGANGPPGVLPSGAAASHGLERIKLEQVVLKITERFRERLREALEKQGVDPGSTFRVQPGPLEAVEVAGQHPMKRSIEQAIESDPELGELFRTLVEASERLHAAGGTLPDGATFGDAGFSLAV